MLQYVVVCCSALQCIPVQQSCWIMSHVRMLQCVAVCWSVLLCVAVRCCALQCNNLVESCHMYKCCSALQCVAVHCSVLQCVAVRQSYSIMSHVLICHAAHMNAALPSTWSSHRQFCSISHTAARKLQVTTTTPHHRQRNIQNKSRNAPVLFNTELFEFFEFADGIWNNRNHIFVQRELHNVVLNNFRVDFGETITATCNIWSHVSVEYARKLRRVIVCCMSPLTFIHYLDTAPWILHSQRLPAIPEKNKSAINQGNIDLLDHFNSIRQFGTPQITNILPTETTSQTEMVQIARSQNTFASTNPFKLKYDSQHHKF